MRLLNRAFLLLIAAWLPLSLAFAQSPKACSTEVCKLAASGHISDLHYPDFPDFKDWIEAAYTAHDGAPLWFHQGTPSSQARSLVALLQDAASEGLKPEDYDGSGWKQRLDGAKQRSSQEIDRLDVALTVSATRYIADVHFGRLNPGLFHSRLDPTHEKFDLTKTILDVANSSDVNALVKGLDPPFDGYRRTREALKQYRELAMQGDIKVPAGTGKTVDPGKPYAGVKALDELLRRLGDLPANAPQPESEVYKGKLVEAVKRFQSRHGIDPDGRIGAATLKQLNTSLSQRVQELELTLERWRWVPHQFSRPPIVVNIPEYRLRATDASYHTELEMKVVVGKAYKNETPVFASDLKEIIFNPYWNVPQSIVQKELIPSIRRDRSYLEKNDFEITTWDDKVVSKGRVTDELLNQLRSGKLTVRQVPGPKNALGPIKFSFPNEHDVYMHSTPARTLFSRTRRDFSHGCIRLEKPVDLAEWVFRAQGQAGGEWTKERIESAMKSGETKKVGLRNGIPVLIVYATAVALEGETRFFDDIYGEDADMLAALEKGPPYPSKKPLKAPAESQTKQTNGKSARKSISQTKSGQ